MPILSWLIAALIGVSLYAGIHFLLHHIHTQQHQARKNLHLFFSLMCFFIVGFMAAELFAYQAASQQAYVEAYRWRANFALLTFTFWSWFVYSYTGVGLRTLVWALSLYSFVQLIPNILLPYGEFFDALPEITNLTLPWGEQIVTHVVNKMNFYGALLWSSLLLQLGYSFYAAICQYRNGQHHQGLMLFLGMLVCSTFIGQTLLVRIGALDFIPLAQFGFPSLVLVVSVALHQESRQRIQRIASILDHVPAVVYMKDTNGKYLMVNREYEILFNTKNAEMLGNTDESMFNQETAAIYREKDLQVLAQKKIVEFDEQIKYSDEVKRTYHTVKFPLFDHHNKAYAVCGISTDITDKRKTKDKLTQSESKFRTLFEAASDAIFIIHEGKIIDCNPKALAIFRSPREKLVGQSLANFSATSQYDGRSSLEHAKEKLVAALKGEPQFFEWRYELQDGTAFDAEVTLNRIELDGKVCIQGIVRDITARRRADEALHSIARGVSGQSGDRIFQQLVVQLSMLFEAKYAFVGVLDKSNKRQVNVIALSADGNIIDNYNYLLDNTPCENVVGQRTCSYPDKVQDLFPKDSMLKDMGLISYIGSPLFDANNTAIGLIVVMDIKPMNDVARLTSVLEIFAARAGAELERVKAEEHIRSLAFNDYLTSLSNRAALHEYIIALLEQLKEKSLAGAMLLIDLDHFKTINDALSHDVGDQVLKLVADRLRKTVSEQDFVARIGGDEFIVIISREQQAPLGDLAGYIAEKIVTALSEPLHLGNRILNIGASVGIVLFPQQGETEVDIMRRADMALYQAKNKGRGIIQFYQSAMQKHADDRLQIERGLRHAIEKDELTLHYQPQLNINGELIGAEALLRWTHSKLGQVPPDRFIPIAEETGLIHAIGHWVFHEACRQYNDWVNSNIPFTGHISVNVSAWQFAAPGFVVSVINALADYHLRPDQIVLELTETALLKDVTDTRDKLSKLRAAGIQVALDDFGTGYSSLAYLKDMPMQILKIDRAFISELTEKNDHPLVETIIDMGQHMNLDIIAEGVETEMQRKILIELGCEVFQGYYFAKPLSATDFVSWLHEHDIQIRQAQQVQ